MAAFVSIAPAPGEQAGSLAGMSAEGACGAETLARLLAAAGVVVGIEQAMLAELGLGLASPGFSCAEVCVAIGSPSCPGDDGYLELRFQAGIGPGALDAEGHMDFFERGLLQGATLGESLGVWHFAEPGVAGTRVDGVSLPAQHGTEITLALGAGVERREGGELLSLRDGAVLYRAGESLDVVEHHVHKGPVDLRSGNLTTQGSLVVQGDVERLLRVAAGGDVEILGSVSGGTVQAGGSVRVQASVRGGDSSLISAEGDVTARTAESASLSAGGTLLLQQAVNCFLQASKIVVTGKLRGGSAVAAHCVTVAEAGSPAANPTLLRAGEPPAPPAASELQRALAAQKLLRMAERSGGRSDTRGKGGKVGRLVAALDSDDLRLRAVRAQSRELLERSAFLQVGIAYPGVELKIGAARLTLEQIVRATRYSYDPETSQLRAERTPA